MWYVIYTQIFLFGIGLLLLKILKHRDIYNNIFLVSIFFSIIFYVFLFGFKQFTNSRQQSFVLGNLRDQLEEMSKSEELFDLYLKDLKQNIYRLKFDCEKSDYSKDLFSFMGLWYDILDNGFLFDLGSCKIVVKDSIYSKLLDKNNNVLIDDSVMYLRVEFPYLYGTYCIGDKFAIYYDFIMNLETNKFFKEKSGTINPEYRIEMANAKEKILFKEPLRIQDIFMELRMKSHAKKYKTRIL